jgi:hypothetical protein
MRFPSPRHLEPKLGWLRLRTVFLFLPTRFRSRWWRWLEFAVIVEEVQLCGEDHSRYAWVPIGFATEPESSTGTRYISSSARELDGHYPWPGELKIVQHVTQLTATDDLTLGFQNTNGALWVFKRLPKNAAEGHIPRASDIRDFAEPVPGGTDTAPRYVLVMRAVDLVAIGRADLIVKVPAGSEECMVEKYRDGPTGPANAGVTAACRFLVKRVG